MGCRRKKAKIMLADCSTLLLVLLPPVLLLLSMAPPMIDCQLYYEQSSVFLAPPSPIPAPPTKTPPMARKGSSMEEMVDVTNLLGVEVLLTHSAANKDNIAFSPYGLLSVIIALYEGAPRDSVTSRQVRTAVGLPADDAILRVGYRDIHRRLRRYFHNQENLLSSIIFNKENITIRSEYEDVLRFYGYDLATYDGFDKPGTEAPDEENSTLSSTTAMSNTTVAEESEEAGEPEDDSETEGLSTTDVPTTTTTMATTSTKSTKKPRKVRSTTKASTTTRKSRTTTTTSAEPPTTATEPPTTTLPTTTTVKTTVSTTTTPRIRAPLPPLTTTRSPRTTTFTTVNTFRPTLPTTTEEYDADSTIVPPTTTYPTTFAAVPAAVLASNRSARLLGGYRKRQPLITLDPTPNWRHKRFIPHENNRIYDQDDNYYPHSIEAEYYVTPIADIPTFAFPEHRTHAFYPSIATTTSHYPPRNEVADVEHFFYLDGLQKINVPFRIYNTILYHAYVPAIKSDVVKFELDSEDYSLMIVLPERDFSLDELLAVMRSKVLGEQVSLRRLNEKLERKWVRAQLPKFNLKGNVLFTNDLQKLGVRELFQPKRADFSFMTDEHTDLYVKHLEQSIDLTIRTQSVKSIMDTPKKYEEINVNYPFLYFIMDKEIDLAIIAGRILNPLNARIQ